MAGNTKAKPSLNRTDKVGRYRVGLARSPPNLISDCLVAKKKPSIGSSGGVGLALRLGLNRNTGNSKAKNAFSLVWTRAIVKPLPKYISNGSSNYPLLFTLPLLPRTFSWLSAVMPMGFVQQRVTCQIIFFHNKYPLARGHHYISNKYKYIPTITTDWLSF